LTGWEKNYVQETILDLEMNDTVFINRLHIVPAGSNKTNQITAKDMARCFRLLATGQAVSRDASQKMIEILKKQQWRNCLPGWFLPPNPKSSAVCHDGKWRTKPGGSTKRFTTGEFYTSLPIP
jgi:hypothetical protein